MKLKPATASETKKLKKKSYNRIKFEVSTYRETEEEWAYSVRIPELICHSGLRSAGWHSFQRSEVGAGPE